MHATAATALRVAPLGVRGTKGDGGGGSSPDAERADDKRRPPQTSAPPVEPGILPQLSKARSVRAVLELLRRYRGSDPDSDGPVEPQVEVYVSALRALAFCLRPFTDMSAARAAAAMAEVGAAIQPARPLADLSRSEQDELQRFSGLYNTYGTYDSQAAVRSMVSELSVDYVHLSFRQLAAAVASLEVLLPALGPPHDRREARDVRGLVTAAPYVASNGLQAQAAATAAGSSAAAAEELKLKDLCEGFAGVHRVAALVRAGVASVQAVEKAAQQGKPAAAAPAMALPSPSPLPPSVGAWDLFGDEDELALLGDGEAGGQGGWAEELERLQLDAIDGSWNFLRSSVLSGPTVRRLAAPAGMADLAAVLQLADLYGGSLPYTCRVAVRRRADELLRAEAEAEAEAPRVKAKDVDTPQPQQRRQQQQQQQLEGAPQPDLDVPSLARLVQYWAAMRNRQPLTTSTAVEDEHEAERDWLCRMATLVLETQDAEAAARREELQAGAAMLKSRLRKLEGEVKEAEKAVRDADAQLWKAGGKAKTGKKGRKREGVTGSGSSSDGDDAGGGEAAEAARQALAEAKARFERLDAEAKSAKAEMAAAERALKGMGRPPPGAGQRLDSAELAGMLAVVAPCVAAGAAASSAASSAGRDRELERLGAVAESAVRQRLDDMPAPDSVAALQALVLHLRRPPTVELLRPALRRLTSVSSAEPSLGPEDAIMLLSVLRASPPAAAALAAPGAVDAGSHEDLAAVLRGLLSALLQEATADSDALLLKERLLRGVLLPLAAAGCRLDGAHADVYGASLAQWLDEARRGRPEAIDAREALLLLQALPDVEGHRLPAGLRQGVLSLLRTSLEAPCDEPALLAELMLATGAALERVGGGAPAEERLPSELRPLLRPALERLLLPLQAALPQGTVLAVGTVAGEDPSAAATAQPPVGGARLADLAHLLFVQLRWRGDGGPGGGHGGDGRAQELLARMLAVALRAFGGEPATAALPGSGGGGATGARLLEACAEIGYAPPRELRTRLYAAAEAEVLCWTGGGAGAGTQDPAFGAGAASAGQLLRLVRSLSSVEGRLEAAGEAVANGGGGNSFTTADSASDHGGAWGPLQALLQAVAKALLLEPFLKDVSARPGELVAAVRQLAALGLQMPPGWLAAYAEALDRLAPQLAAADVAAATNGLVQLLLAPRGATEVPAEVSEPAEVQGASLAAVASCLNALACCAGRLELEADGFTRRDLGLLLADLHSLVQLAPRPGPPPGLSPQARAPEDLAAAQRHGGEEGVAATGVAPGTVVAGEVALAADDGPGSAAERPQAVRGRAWVQAPEPEPVGGTGEEPRLSPPELPTSQAPTASPAPLPQSTTPLTAAAVAAWGRAHTLFVSSSSSQPPLKPQLKKGKEPAYDALPSYSPSELVRVVGAVLWYELDADRSGGEGQDGRCADEAWLGACCEALLLRVQRPPAPLALGLLRLGSRLLCQPPTATAAGATQLASGAPSKTSLANLTARPAAAAVIQVVQASLSTLALLPAEQPPPGGAPEGCDQGADTARQRPPAVQVQLAEASRLLAAALAEGIRPEPAVAAAFAVALLEGAATGPPSGLHTGGSGFLSGPAVADPVDGPGVLELNAAEAEAEAGAWVALAESLQRVLLPTLPLLRAAVTADASTTVERDAGNAWRRQRLRSALLRLAPLLPAASCCQLAALCVWCSQAGEGVAPVPWWRAVRRELERRLAEEAEALTAEAEGPRAAFTAAELAAVCYGLEMGGAGVPVQATSRLAALLPSAGAARKQAAAASQDPAPRAEKGEAGAPVADGGGAGEAKPARIVTRIRGVPASLAGVLSLQLLWAARSCGRLEGMPAHAWASAYGMAGRAAWGGPPAEVLTWPQLAQLVVLRAEAGRAHEAAQRAAKYAAASHGAASEALQDDGGKEGDDDRSSPARLPTPVYLQDVPEWFAASWLGALAAGSQRAKPGGDLSDREPPQSKQGGPAVDSDSVAAWALAYCLPDGHGESADSLSAGGDGLGLDPWSQALFGMAASGNRFRWRPAAGAQHSARGPLPPYAVPLLGAALRALEEPPAGVGAGWQPPGALRLADVAALLWRMEGRPGWALPAAPRDALVARLAGLLEGQSGGGGRGGQGSEDAAALGEVAEALAAVLSSLQPSRESVTAALPALTALAPYADQELYGTVVRERSARAVLATGLAAGLSALCAREPPSGCEAAVCAAVVAARTMAALLVAGPFAAQVAAAAAAVAAGPAPSDASHSGGRAGAVGGAVLSLQRNEVAGLVAALLDAGGDAPLPAAAAAVLLRLLSTDGVVADLNPEHADRAAHHSLRDVGLPMPDAVAALLLRRWGIRTGPADSGEGAATPLQMWAVAQQQWSAPRYAEALLRAGASAVWGQVALGQMGSLPAFGIDASVILRGLEALRSAGVREALAPPQRPVASTAPGAVAAMREASLTSRAGYDAQGPYAKVFDALARSVVVRSQGRRLIEAGPAGPLGHLLAAAMGGEGLSLAEAARALELMAALLERLDGAQCLSMYVSAVTVMKGCLLARSQAELDRMVAADPAAMWAFLEAASKTCGQFYNQLVHKRRLRELAEAAGAQGDVTPTDPRVTAAEAAQERVLYDLVGVNGSYLLTAPTALMLWRAVRPMIDAHNQALKEFDQMHPHLVGQGLADPRIGTEAAAARTHGPQLLPEADPRVISAKRLGLLYGALALRGAAASKGTKEAELKRTQEVDLKRTQEEELKRTQEVELKPAQEAEGHGYEGFRGLKDGGELGGGRWAVALAYAVDPMWAEAQLIKSYLRGAKAAGQAGSAGGAAGEVARAGGAEAQRESAAAAPDAAVGGGSSAESLIMSSVLDNDVVRALLPYGHAWIRNQKQERQVAAAAAEGAVGGEADEEGQEGAAASGDPVLRFVWVRAPGPGAKEEGGGSRKKRKGRR
ncbi:hypothetical protein GPECTOR_9g686 [Gonium pectorale]|uniref:Uncharacterized protein n=1 Tax=Gonium pectorale TaxID=33097 RepID=A0A150GS57_GONPE|nr:hypothetical protein GPECTOR_9g686 [Gonium pectorale]|eukprot:KXZ52641.1 hypothetical protein GPECTOR_9g686 [Gonium pectorale]